ncbi:MAG: hypothetical protein P4L46_26255 [Fimbriimonas sp.]|nr:hypothetical protein [Fimbriimonas sp.]
MRGLLLSLEGDGGTGKTRLALELMNRANDRGLSTRFVSCEHLIVPPGDGMEVRSLESFVELLTQTLAVGAVESGESLVFERLNGRASMTILDNLETVACPAIAEFLQRLMAACPHTILLCTSRLGVGAEPENTFDLNGGMEPDDGSRLLRLRFSESLPLDAPARKLTTAELRRIAKLCSGLPLAIENLAAMARTPLQPIRVAAELKALAQGAPDRRDITGHFRNPLAGDRRRSLEASCQWGYRQIERWAGDDSGAVQRAYRITGVFAGPFTSEEFEAVAGLGNSKWLADLQSAYVVSADVVQGVWMQNPFQRGFAARLLEESQESEAVKGRFLELYLGLLKKEGPRLGEMAAKAERMRMAQPNWIRACHMLADRIDEGNLEAAGRFHDLRFAMQNSAWYLRWDIQSLFERVESSAKRVGAIHCQADCARGMGTVHLCFRPNARLAKRRFEQAIELYRQVEDREGEGDCLRCLADCLPAEEREARMELLERALELLPESCQLQRAWVWRRRASFELDPEIRAANFDSARRQFVILSRPADAAACDIDRANDLAQRGELVGALALRESALRLSRETGDAWLSIRILLEGLDWQVTTDPQATAVYLDVRRARGELVEARAMNEVDRDSILAARIELHEGLVSASLGDVVGARERYAAVRPVFAELPNAFPESCHTAFARLASIVN